MNNTLSYFPNFNKYKTIQIFNRTQNHQLTYNENKHNSSNLFNKIESIIGNNLSNLYYQTEKNAYANYKDIYKYKNKGKNIINNLKNLSVQKNKIYNNNNNINILKFKHDTCNKTINSHFTGKKVFLSKYSLMNKRKLSENEKNKNNIQYLLCNDGKDNKTLEINSTLFEQYQNNVNRYLNTCNGNFFSTKIEKELNDILNKNKNNKTENNSDNNKNQFNDKSYNSLINNNNESKLKYNNENIILLENKIIKDKKGNYINIRKDLFNQYLNSNIIKRKVLFIDKYNNTLSNDNTITLLSEEKDLLLEKYIIHKDDKGNEVNLPLLQRYNKTANENTKFLTEFNNNLGKQNNTTNDQTQSSSLSQLIKNRFTKQNYKNIKITGTTSEYEYYSGNANNGKYNMKNDESSNNITSKYKNNKNNDNNYKYNINNNYNNIKIPIETKRNRKKEIKLDGFNDLLGEIKAKTIGPKTQKNKNKENKNIYKSPNKKSEINNKKKSTLKKQRKKLKRLLSQPNIISNVYQISKKVYFNKEKEINSLINTPITVKDVRGKKMRVTLIKKKDKIIPINEEGNEIKNAKILNDLYYQVKEKIKSEEEKNLLPKKRLTCSNTKNNIASLKLFDDLEGNNDTSKSSIDDLDNNKENEKEKINSDEEKNKKENNSPIKRSPMKKRKSILINSNTNSILHNSPKKKEKKSENIQKNENVIKNVKIKEDSFYKEEDDFVKDFNFDFDSSEDETTVVSLTKLMRQTQKKINKYLFKIFEFISKNADMENFKKEDLIKFLIEKNFRSDFRLLKEQIIKLRELVRDSLDPEGKEKKKKIYIKDMEIINYIYRYIKNKNSLFYKSIYKRIKKEQEEERKHSNTELNYNKLIGILKDSYMEQRTKRNFSLYSQRKGENSGDKRSIKLSPKKFKKKKVNRDFEYISQDEKKKLLLNEINLTNEIRYQISISHDKESKEKFKNLLNKIESLRKLSGDDYVKSLKENFLMFKDEAEDILNAKEIEERLNGFIDDLNYQRNNFKDKHKYIMSSMFIKDNKFLSVFENEALE